MSYMRPLGRIFFVSMHTLPKTPLFLYLLQLFLADHLRSVKCHTYSAIAFIKTVHFILIKNTIKALYFVL